LQSIKDTLPSGRNADWGQPHLPPCPALSVDGQPLTSIRDTLTCLPPDPGIERATMSVVDRWRSEPRSIEPVRELRGILNGIRVLPRGESRLAAMNTYVRTLGQAQVLATLLDMLRDSTTREGTYEEELTRPSRNGSKHAVYGWAGQTLLFLTEAGPSAGTVEAEPRILELLGETETPGLWALAMHIWQPNPYAEGFPTGARIESGVIVEPPHSHPFDFASMVSVGVMHQSIYDYHAPQEAAGNLVAYPGNSRYDGIRLEHVDDTWPEHVYRSGCELTTVESSVALTAGDSYFMPTDKIHDVEIEAKVAATTPAITLFLASEAVVVAHVYMAKAMADYHDANPDLRKRGSALSATAWQAKLQAVAAYLRGEQPTLQLDDIVRHDGDYAFFHKA